MGASMAPMIFPFKTPKVTVLELASQTMKLGTAFPKDAVSQAHLLRAHAVGEDLQPGIDVAGSDECRQKDGRPARSLYGFKDPGAAAHVKAGTILLTRPRLGASSSRTILVRPSPME